MTDGHNEGMTTFITRYETSGPGIRLAVKDLIDMEGEPTTGRLPCRGGPGGAGDDRRGLLGRGA